MSFEINTVTVNGTDLSALSSAELTALLGYVFTARKAVNAVTHARVNADRKAATARKAARARARVTRARAAVKAAEKAAVKAGALKAR